MTLIGVTVRDRVPVSDKRAVTRVTLVTQRVTTHNLEGKPAMSEQRRAPYRVTGLDEFGLPAEPPPLPPPPPPGVGALSRRSLITATGGLALGGLTLMSGGDEPVRVTAQQNSTGEPPIYGCDSWGARPASSQLTILNKKPEKVLVHHTATKNVDDMSANALGELCRSIQKFHMSDRGWEDTGQNFTISRGGYIAEGRHESLRTLLGGQSFVEGAHCTNQNDSSIGIENEGTYTEVQPPLSLFNALTVMCAYICNQYDIQPTQLYGHRDFWDTACPGDKLYALLPTLRGQVARLMAAQKSQQQATQSQQQAAQNQQHPRRQAPRHQPDARRMTLLESYYVPSWPLLRITDQGPTVLAAQYLLRNAGMAKVPTDGQFGRAMADGVYEFQRRHHLPVTGMIGGGSWPLLAVPVKAGQGGNAELAVQVLTRAHRSAGKVPSAINQAVWQRLLSGSTPL
jgi:hypothetical protein